MQSKEEISFCKLLRCSHLLPLFMQNATNFSEVHLFVLKQDEIVQHCGKIINLNVTLCKLCRNHEILFRPQMVI